MGPGIYFAPEGRDQPCASGPCYYVASSSGGRGLGPGGGCPFSCGRGSLAFVTRKAHPLT